MVLWCAVLLALVGRVGLGSVRKYVLHTATSIASPLRHAERRCHLVLAIVPTALHSATSSCVDATPLAIAAGLSGMTGAMRRSLRRQRSASIIVPSVPASLESGFGATSGGQAAV